MSELEASLTVESRTTSDSKPCDPGAAAMMQRILTGCAQKVMAYELEVAPSTASFRIATTLKAFGLMITTRRAPLALAMLASSHAASTNCSPPGYYEVPTGTPGRLELRMPRPEGRLRRYVSPAEYDVLKAVVEGDSYREAGVRFNRSPRTVANQLRSVTVKVGVCGRLQFVDLAVRLCLGFGQEPGQAR